MIVTTMLNQFLARLRKFTPGNHREFMPVGHVEPDDRRKMPSDIGRRGAVDEEFKLEMARALADGYLEWGDRIVVQVLERLLDVRLCSMITYRLAVALFDVGGAAVLERRPELERLMNMDLSVTAARNVIDHSFDTRLMMPVRYCGYGHPVNSREHLGHLFQVNMCSFSSASRIIGYRDNHDGDIEIIKGMVKEGNAGGWHLYRLDPDMSDDLTAIFTVASVLPDRLIEVCHFKEEDTPVIYRFAKNKIQRDT